MLSRKERTKTMVRKTSLGERPVPSLWRADEEHPVLVRPGEGLYQTIRTRAIRNERSVGREIVAIIKSYLEREERALAAPEGSNTHTHGEGGHEG